MPKDFRVNIPSHMKNLHTKKSRHASTDHEFIVLPNDQQLPLLNSPLRLTRKLWESIPGTKNLCACSDIVDDLCVYTMFAILGLTGFNREPGTGRRSLLIPVVFESGRSIIRLSCHRSADGSEAWTLSLPEEHGPFV